MKNGELEAAELERIVGAAWQETADDRRFNIGDSPNVTVDVEPI